MWEELAYLREMNVASILLRLVLAMLFGGFIGLERERKRRPAGFRTYMLVCLGAALTMLTQGKGNCYNFTALFTACARQLGYQAYNVAGQEYSPTNDHAWTMIDWPDGVTYLFDVQLECAYLYLYSNKPVINMFKVSGSDGIYNSFVYYFP